MKRSPVYLFLLFVLLSCTSMEDLFLKEKNDLISISQTTDKSIIFTHELVSSLPYPLQHHIESCGFIGKPVMSRAEVIWESSSIRLDPGKDWQPLETQQFNTIKPLGRLSYMKFLNMPVSGRDIYYSGTGEMKGKLFELFPVINGQGKEVSVSALITVFTEFVFIPSYVLQNYVTWETIDSTHVRAILKDGGHTVSGVFHFDHDGLFSRFDTDDRYYSAGNGKYIRTPFSAIVGSYQKKGTLTYPKDIKIVWHLDGGDYEYFKGTVDSLIFDL